MLALLSLILPAVADAVDADVIQQTLSEYAAHASHPLPALSDAQVERLLEGRSIKMRLPSVGKAPDGAMVMLISDLPRSDLWLGSMDAEHFGTASDLTIHHMPLLSGELFRWYGFVDLPAPFGDRHFLIRTTINRQLPAASGGAMWERSWALEDRFIDTMAPVVASGAVEGVDRALFEAAIAVPVNFGAWILLDLPDGRTLLGYHCATSLGGEIPDGLVTRYVFWGLDSLMQQVTDAARAMPVHYSQSHEVLTGGDGQPIPRY